MFRISGDAIPGSGYATTSLNETRNDTHSLTMQFYANYKLQLKRHSIGLMAGYEDLSLIHIYTNCLNYETNHCHKSHTFVI